MNKFVSLMAIFVIALFAGNSFAFTPPPTPAPSSWISDTSGVLSGAAHRRLDDRLKQINQSSANEVAALIVPTLEGEDISDVANATFKSWGVGKRGLDNGVLVVLAMKEHKSRIETGKGVEGDLPDLKTQDILNQVLRPHMKKGDVEGALDSTFTAISSSIENHRADVASAAKANPPPVVVNPASPVPTTNTSPSCDVSAVGSGTSVLGLLVLLFFAAMLMLNRAAKKQEKVRQQAELLARQKREQERQTRLAEQQRMAEERKQTLAKLERERQELRAKAEREQAVRRAAREHEVITVPVIHPKPVVHHEPPHPITRSVVHSEGPHKQESIASVASAAAIITAAAVAEREAILARQRDFENQRAETKRLAERESAKREAERESAERRQEEAERSRARQREADEAEDRARRQREQDDEDRRRRDSESSSSSSSSYDYGSSSSGSDSNSSGGFGGGDSGGGGSSSDW
jgi:uncharacterized membrane protein YgcG